MSGKVAIVTGASSGLGVTFAKALGEHGASVVITARREQRLRKLARSMSADGIPTLAVRCDITHPVQVDSMVKKTLKHFGRVDVLVNNASGVMEESPYAEHVSDKGFEETVRVNLLGTWHCTRAVAPHMLAQRSGSIINISSIGGLGAILPIGPAYSAAKGGVGNLTRILALNWGDRGVRVNAIAPGYFPSEMSEPYLTLPGVKAKVSKMAALGRIGEPSELVGALLLLASDAGSFITGQTLAVDGGLSAGLGVIPVDEAGHEVFFKKLGEPFGKRMAVDF
jgi:NAD(P)-dependent dehydrogenase (short-subunit alcohol dehydrogenase family)